MSPLGKHCYLRWDATVSFLKTPLRGIKLGHSEDWRCSGSRRRIHPRLLSVPTAVNFRQNRSVRLHGPFNVNPCSSLSRSLSFLRFTGSATVNQPEKHGKRLISWRQLKGGGKEGRNQVRNEKKLEPPQSLQFGVVSDVFRVPRETNKQGKSR